MGQKFLYYSTSYLVCQIDRVNDYLAFREEFGYLSLQKIRIPFIVPTVVLAKIIGSAFLDIPYNTQRVHAVKNITRVRRDKSFVCLLFHVRITCGNSITTLRIVAVYTKMSGLIINTV